MEVKRDRKIDILRFIAIMCIVLAHSEPSGIIFQLRNFDVPLMVLLMGASFYLSNKDKRINYFNYLYKRFKRLVIPTWIFLTVFFSLFFIVSIITGDKYYFTINNIFTSYVMINGIGYVWIMKVFFIIAAISPFILMLSEKIKNNMIYFAILLGGYAIYVILVFFHNVLSGKVQLLFEHFFLHGFGYGLIAAIGLRLSVMKRKEILFGCILFVLVFSSLMIWHEFSPTQPFKYPPTMYYFSYGLFVSLLLYLLLDISWINKLLSNKYVFFLSEKSLWLYFWHIIPIYILKIFGSEMPIVNNNFVTRFMFILVIAVLITYVHERIKTKVKGIKNIPSKAA